MMKTEHLVAEVENVRFHNSPLQTLDNILKVVRALAWCVRIIVGMMHI